MVDIIKFIRNVDAVLRVTAAFVCFLLISSKAHSSTNCYSRLSPIPFDVSFLNDELAYLEFAVSNFDEVERQYANDAIYFYIPRMRNAKSLMKDLAYTLKAIDGNPREGWGDDLRYQLIHVFSGIQHWRLHVTKGVGSVPNGLRNYFLDNYDAYRPLLDYHLSAYHTAHFFDPCPSGTPYHFFFNLAALELAKTQPASISPQDILKGAGFRQLEGSTQYRRTYYYVGPERAPTIRMVLPNCVSGTIGPVVLDFEYNPTLGDWEKIDLQARSSLNLYGWFADGFSDFGHGEVNKWRISTDGLYQAYQNEQEKRFLDAMALQGISIKMPNIDNWECM